MLQDGGSFGRGGGIFFSLCDNSNGLDKVLKQGNCGLGGDFFGGLFIICDLIGEAGDVGGDTWCSRIETGGGGKAGNGFTFLYGFGYIASGL